MLSVAQIKSRILRWLQFKSESHHLTYWVDGLVLGLYSQLSVERQAAPLKSFIKVFLIWQSLVWSVIFTSSAIQKLTEYCNYPLISVALLK